MGDIERGGLTPSEKAREILFELNKERLEQMAYNAIHIKHLRPDQIIMVAIDVDDPTWKQEVDFLMPGHDWQQYRDRGEEPIVARGSVNAAFGEYLSKVVPALAPAFAQPVPKGLVRAVIMGSKGASVYHIIPHPNVQMN